MILDEIKDYKISFVTNKSEYEAEIKKGNKKKFFKRHTNNRKFGKTNE